MLKTLWRVVGIQLLAALLAWWGTVPGTWEWALAQGLCASALSWLYKAPLWQRLLHLLFVPLVVLMLSLQLPAWVYLLGLMVTLLFGRNAFVERVPFYRSSQATSALLAEYIPLGANVLEAGCADARLALRLLKRRKDLHIVGMENTWGNYVWGWCRWWWSGRPTALMLCCDNFWKRHWGEFDVIYVFLSPEPMSAIWAKFIKEGHKNSILISNTFTIPGKEPDERLPLDGALQKELLIWRHPYGS